MPNSRLNLTFKSSEKIFLLHWFCVFWIAISQTEMLWLFISLVKNNFSSALFCFTQSVLAALEQDKFISWSPKVQKHNKKETLILFPSFYFSLSPFINVLKPKLRIEQMSKLDSLILHIGDSRSRYFNS